MQVSLDTVQPYVGQNQNSTGSINHAELQSIYVILNLFQDRRSERPCDAELNWTLSQAPFTVILYKYYNC